MAASIVLPNIFFRTARNAARGGEGGTTHLRLASAGLPDDGDSWQARSRTNAALQVLHESSPMATVPPKAAPPVEI